MAIDLDREAALVRIDGRRIPMPTLQRRTLAMLLRRPGDVVPTRDLLNALWPGQDEACARRRLKVQIYRVRRRLDGLPGPSVVSIRSVRGDGYAADVALRTAAVPAQRSESPAGPPNGIHRGEYGVRLLTISGVQLDLDALQLRCGPHRSDLTVAEFHLLRVLMENAGRVLSPHRLTGEVWIREPNRDPRILHEYVGRVRRRLTAVNADPTLLRTVRNGGYVFDRIGPSPRPALAV